MQPVIGKMSNLLAIDIGLVEIQAHLIGVHDNKYRWEGVGRHGTTITVTGNIDGKCLTQALDQLARSTGHELFGDRGELITPMTGSRRGVDKICLTWSLPASIKAILVGLAPGYSIHAGHLLMADLPIEMVDSFSMTDVRSIEDRIDSVLSNRPELIILAGGFDGGASRVLKDQIDLVVQAVSIMPQNMRPEIIYAGNQKGLEYTRSKIDPLTLMTSSQNIRPSLSDIELQPAREALAETCTRIWIKLLEPNINKQPLKVNYARPAMRAMEDINAIMAVYSNSKNGSITTYLDGLSTTIAVSLNDRNISCRYESHLQSTHPMRARDGISAKDVTAWSPVLLSQDEVEEELMVDAIHPGRVPVSERNAALTSAVTQFAGRSAWHSMAMIEEFPQSLRSDTGGADVDTILICGSRLYNRQSYGVVLLEMLNILQPVGFADIYLDREGVAASLGTAAHLAPSIPIHCLCSDAIPKLATLIAPVFRAHDHAAALSIRVVNSQGKATTHEIQVGSLASIPVPIHDKVRLQLLPLRRMHFGLRKSWRKEMIIAGSVLGIVIDARGRPLTPRKDEQAQTAWMERCLEQARELDR